MKPRNIKDLLNWAQERGWECEHAKRHWKLKKNGCQIVFVAVSPGDWRTVPNTIARIKKAERVGGFHLGD